MDGTAFQGNWYPTIAQEENGKNVNKNKKKSLVFFVVV